MFFGSFLMRIGDPAVQRGVMHNPSCLLSVVLGSTGAKMKSRRLIIEMDGSDGAVIE